MTSIHTENSLWPSELKRLLSNEQRLTKEHISAISRALLKEVLQNAGTLSGYLPFQLK